MIALAQNTPDIRKLRIMFTLPKPLAHHSGILEVVRQFTPNWFTVTMGTGVVALVLNQLPVPLLHGVGAGLWYLNIALFTLCSAAYAGRWVMFPAEAARIADHPVMPMFLGAIPMGLATIVNGCLVFGLPAYGQAAVGIAEWLWWVDAGLAIGVGLLVPLLMFTRQQHTVESMTAVWLLPLVASEVTAASGGLLAPHLVDPQAALHILVFSYVLWALSVPLALGVLVILFLRLVLHKLPKQDMAVSSWLTLGPLGTGALGLLLLGRDAPAILTPFGLADVGLVAHGIGVIGGLLLWGYGAWWLAIAVAVTLTYLRSGLPFNMGWWGFTFPLGVYTLATLNLAQQTGMAFFDIAGGLLAVMLISFWVIVTARTIAGGYHGHLFSAPCVAGQPAALPQKPG